MIKKYQMYSLDINISFKNKTIVTIIWPEKSSKRDHSKEQIQNKHMRLFLFYLTDLPRYLVNIVNSIFVEPD